VSEVEELTDQQRVFVEHYLTCWNGAEAARRAGYAEDAAAQQASRLLRIVKVRDLIEQRIGEIAMGADEVLLRLAEQARADVGDFIKIDKRGRVSLDLPRAQREGRLRLVKSLVPTQFGMKLELHDAQAALALLGKHHKLFTEKVEHSGNVDVARMSDDELERLAKQLGLDRSG
jgi:phage terminase small subunit